MQSGRDDAARGRAADRRFGNRPQFSNATPGGRRRNLSQNFLADRRAAAQFVQACGLTSTDRVVEVGAGAGALTCLIAGRVAELTAFEPDASLGGKLRAATRDFDNVSVVFADVLTGPLPAGTTKLVGNIPFGRTAELIRWTLEQAVESATFITQLEYARKRTGHAGRWSQLTIETWPTVDWSLGPRISRNSFRPVPAVDAAVLTLTFRAQPLLTAAQSATYQDIVATGFKGVGGTLFKSLQALCRPGELSGAFARAGLDRDVVVAFVPPEAWLVLATELGPVGQQRSGQQRSGQQRGGGPPVPTARTPRRPRPRRPGRAG